VNSFTTDTITFLLTTAVGIVAMSASPFYDSTSPLRFRGVKDSLALEHIEGSECCLIHADNRLSSSLGVWINPNVRVGYCHADLHKPQKIKQPYSWELFKNMCQMSYDAVHPPSGSSWVTPSRVAWGLWENRMRRWLSWGVTASWKVRRKLRAWEDDKSGKVEPGEMCLVDEMHVIEYVWPLHVYCVISC
jgi:hypothetical protein